MCDTPIVQPVQRDVDVYIAVSRGRELARQIGFDDIDRTRIEIVILELTRNILVHAGQGTLTLGRAQNQHRSGIHIEAHDDGPGIIDLDLALRDGYSTAQTLGAGLPGVRRLMHEFTIQSTPGVGTTVRVFHWLPVARGGFR